MAIILEKTQLEVLIKSLHLNEVVGLPTETVYGLAVKIDSPQAYEKLIIAKNRPKEKAFPVVVGNQKDIYKLGEVNEKIERIISHFLPGPLTIILKKKPSLKDYITAGQDTIAIRYSSDPFLCQLIEKVQCPLLLTSANKSGETPVKDEQEALKVFEEKVAFLVKGQGGNQIASTIVDLTKAYPKILRKGVIFEEEITKVWEEK